MNIEITNKEIEEAKELVEQYKMCSADGTYWQNIADFAVNLLIKNGVCTYHVSHDEIIFQNLKSVI